MEHIPFGTFNPRFYGVSIMLGDKDRLAFSERYAEAKDPDEWAKSRAATSLSEVSTNSAIDHERRHFHDFLLSPLGTIIMGLRMQASINGGQALVACSRCRGSFVPVPLPRWIQWDDGARRRWFESDGKAFGIAKYEDIVDLPHVPDVEKLKLKVGSEAVSKSLSPEKQLALYAVGAAEAYASMTKWRQRRVSQYDINVSADDVCEGVAHLVQLQAVWTGQGEAAAGTLYSFIKSSPAKHLLPLQILWTALERSSRPVKIDRVAELLTWMLLGSWQELASTGHPANRYFQILELAALSPDNLTAEKPVSQLFDYLDQLTRSAAWKGNLSSAAASADRRLAFYESLAKSLKGDYPDALFAVAKIWHADQHSVRQKFVNDPASIANPLRYLDEALPLPFVECRLGSLVHEREAPLVSPRHRAIALDPEGKRVLCYVSKLAEHQSEVDLDHVVSARKLTHMIDFLFADEPSLDLFEEWCKLRLRSTIGKEFVSVY